MANKVGKPRIPIHALVIGDSGAGKDTFIASWPKPMLVWHVDGMGQDMPYMQDAKEISDIQYLEIGEAKVPFRDITTNSDDLIRIEYYSSNNPMAPDMIEILDARRELFPFECEQWKTLAVGSLSAVAQEARYYDQYVMNPTAKTPLKWYGAAGAYIERLIAMQRNLPINIAYMAHNEIKINEQTGERVNVPLLPGKQAFDAGKYFGEIYRIYVDRESGLHMLQSKNDGIFVAKTHIKVPNPMVLIEDDDDYFERLWDNW